MTVATANLREAALDLAADGVAVFPCNADKSPRIAGGFHGASSDIFAVSAMPWDGEGTLIGAAIAPGTFVVDVDPRNGGNSTLDAAQQGRVWLTKAVATKSGGSHYYFSVPEGVELRPTLGPGVDIKRAGRGYVIVPPSPGYRVAVDEPTAKAPDWLLDELVATDAPERGEAASPKFFPFERGTTYGLAAMERIIGRLAVVQEGGRNNALNLAAFDLAQYVAGGELDEDTARDALESVAERIGLEHDEAEKTIDSGWKAGELKPLQAPPQVEVETRREDEAVALTDATPDPEAEGRFWVDWDVDEDPPPFLCRPMLPANAYVLVFGATEAAKSMTWLGLLAEGSHHGVRSSFYSLENPPATDRDRLRRWAPDPANFRLTNHPIDFNDPRQVDNLIRREKDWGADVLLFDTYSHAFNSRSEDGNAKAIEFARRVRWVMHEVGCSVVVVDHTGFEGEEPRDASAKRQQVDVAILMKKRGEWAPGSSAKFTMSNRKAARFANPFPFLNGEIRDVEREGRKGLALAWEGDAPRWER